MWTFLNISFQFDFLFNLDDDDQVVVSLAYTIPREAKLDMAHPISKSQREKGKELSSISLLYNFVVITSQSLPF